MTFEVPVSAVSRRHQPWGVVAVAGASGLIVLGAIAAGLAAPAASPRAPAAAAGRGEAAAVAPAVAGTPAAPIPTPHFEPASFNRPLPTAMECHDVAATACRRMVRAALRILPDDLPTVGWAAAWDSLVCNDDFDCPPGNLRDSQPLGSVALGFTDGSPAVTINVVDWGYGPSIRLGLRAWLVPTY